MFFFIAEQKDAIHQQQMTVTRVRDLTVTSLQSLSPSQVNFYVIYHIHETVFHRDNQTLKQELKIRCATEDF